MKQKFFKIPVIVICLFLSFPRTVDGQATRFSIYTDPLLSWMKEDEGVDSHGPVLAYRVGLGVDHFFSRNYALSFDFLIQRTGGRVSYPDAMVYQVSETTDTLPAGRQIKYGLQYFSLPLGLKFTTDEIGYLTFYAQLGINPQIRMKAQSKTSYSPLDGADMSDEISLLNLGYYFGAGAYYSLGGNTALIIGIQYFGGLLDVTRNKADNIGIHHTGLQLGIKF